MVEVPWELRGFAVVHCVVLHCVVLHCVVLRGVEHAGVGFHALFAAQRTKERPPSVTCVAGGAVALIIYSFHACDLSNASCSSYLLTAAWCLRAHFSTFISAASCCFAATSSMYDRSSQLVNWL